MYDTFFRYVSGILRIHAYFQFTFTAYINWKYLSFLNNHVTILSKRFHWKDANRLSEYTFNYEYREENFWFFRHYYENFLILF